MAQYRATVAVAGKGRASGALELDFESFELPEQQRAAVTELAGPDAELVPRVHAGQCIGTIRVAGKHFQIGTGFIPPGRQAQLRPQRRVAGDPAGRGQRRGAYAGVKRGAQLGETLLPGQRGGIWEERGGGLLHARIVTVRALLRTVNPSIQRP